MGIRNYLSGLLNAVGVGQIVNDGASKVIIGGDGVAVHVNEIGTYADYREMRCGPTVSLAMAVVTSAIRSADWMTEADEDVPEEITAGYSAMMDELRADLMKNIVLSLSYGFQVIHTPWTMNADGKMVIERIKPIKPDDVKSIEIYDESGELKGVLLTDKTYLPAEEVLLITYDGEGGNPFGRSRHENIRKYAYEPWKRAITRLDEYSIKSSGTIPIIHYPEGEVVTADGQTITNDKVAQIMLGHLPKGKGVVVPNTLMNFAGDALKQSGASLKELRAWSISFLQSSSGFGGELLQFIKHFEALQMRGWLVPERAAIEGTSGTKAEAEAHAGVMIDTAEEDADGFTRAINKQIANRYLVQNYGESYRGKVRTKAASIVDDRIKFLEQIALSVLTNPANIDILTSLVDFDAVLDGVNVPKIKEVANIEDAKDPSAPAETPETTQLSRRGRTLSQFLRTFKPAV